MSGSITRRECLKSGIAFSALLTTAPIGYGVEKTTVRPNIVILMADGLGYGDVGIYGSPDIRTPAIDRLARQGVRFSQFYAGAPESTPARAAILTGRYPQRVAGLECDIGYGNTGQYDDANRLAKERKLGLPSSEATISKFLKQGGYSNALVGKWHLGYEIEFYPINFGFDYFWGILGGGVDYFYHTEPNGSNQLYRDQGAIQREGYLTDLIADESVQFIQRQKNNKPFFLTVSFTAPHAPYQKPDDPREKPVSEAAWNQGSRETYVATIERMDGGIEKILAALDKQGLAENSLVVFCSSNGGDQYADNGSLAQGQGTLFEGGIRVPCIVRWPERISQDSVTHKVAIAMDLTASIARIAGVKALVGRPFDGLDILAEIERDRADMSRTLFWRIRRGDRTRYAVRDGDMKYISERTGEKNEEYLFDLSEDPLERKNRIELRADIASNLRSMLRAWERDIQPVR